MGGVKGAISPNTLRLKTHTGDLEGAPFADLPIPWPLGVHTWAVHSGRNNPNNFL